jgi:branched-chain amino acid transport system permease protein
MSKKWFFLSLFFLDSIIGPQTHPFYFNLLFYTGINIILATSLNLINGIIGQFSMGHAGFMSIGAYAAAFLSIHTQPRSFVGFLLCLFLAACFSALSGILVGLMSFRLKGDYFAIATLGFSEIIRVLIFNLSFLGGSQGLSCIPLHCSLSFVMITALLTTFFFFQLYHSSFGRVCIAIREDEIAAESIGINPALIKTAAFGIGAFFAGLAGGLFAHYLQYLNPQTFDFNRSFEMIIMVVLGGTGSISGSVLAAVLLTVSKELLRPLQEWTHIDFRMILYSVMLIGLMLLRPQGICGKNEIFLKRKTLP